MNVKNSNKLGRIKDHWPKKRSNDTKGRFFTENFTNHGQKDKLKRKIESKTENNTIYGQINQNSGPK